MKRSPGAEHISLDTKDVHHKLYEKALAAVLNN